MEKRIVRKMDLRIMPWIIVCYLLNYLDRTNLGNARTLNNDIPGHSLSERLDLQGDRYNFIVAIFFVPYVLFEFPSNIALKYFTPSRWIARIMVSWGIVTMCTAAVSSYTGLIICRIFLGIMEAGFFPGIMMYLCFWYKPNERGVRMALFSASVAVSGAFGGLIATGVSFMSGKGGLYGWQWLFILEGAPTIIVGVLVWFYLPDFPETAKFLTQDERQLAIDRMGDFAPKGTDKHFDKADFIRTVCAWEFWAFALCYFFMTNSLNAFGFFAPTIISGLGFTGYKGQLLTVPPNAFAFFVIIGNSWWSDRRKERVMHILGGLVFVMIGYVLLASVDSVGGRYVGVFMIACTNAAVIPFIAYRTATVTGATSTAIATGGVIAIANIAGAVAPFLFPSKDSPRYFPGLWTLFAMLGAAGCIVGLLWYKLGGSSEYRGSTIETVPAAAESAEEEYGDDKEGGLAADGGVRIKELGKTATM
ncbi:major facilitator superfamily transporter [Dioszegia hungarica]|uniref:Major facilitator superfamily transporter n=1 Tax=Dioszegia hungarica TaxID=4972 RepID=A0AA38H1U6_9TREE|nr:major facilitator superfamily transporter [Dioszegia hungarica]KAI9632137.1 major facilitator superfamily transporter [Dioszegia hungarica]